MATNWDLVNSCLVCRDVNKDGDFEYLYDTDGSDLSETGKLYEELFRIELWPSERSYYPQFLCKSCELQMKLFKKLIVKAVKNFEILKNQLETHHENKLDTENSHSADPSKVEYLEKTNEVTYHSLLSLIDEEDLSNNEELSEKDIISDPKEEAEEVTDALETRSATDIQIEIELMQFNENSSQGSIDGKNMYTNVDYLESSDMEESLVEEKIVKRYNKSSAKARSNKQNARTFRCYACAIEFTKRVDYTTHRKTLHLNKFPCPECPKLLATSDALSVHLKLHKDAPAFECNLCEKTFNQKVHYQYHMDKHNDVRQFKCEHCDKAFISRADLNVHMRSHTGERRYPCDVCGKRFFLLQHLKMHKYSHKETKSMSCVICNQKFVSPSTLHMHIQTIHSMPQFQCAVCTKQFRRKHHLIAHSKVHDDSKQKKPRKYVTADVDDPTELIVDGIMSDYEEFLEVT